MRIRRAGVGSSTGALPGLFLWLRGVAALALIASASGCSFTSPDAATGSQYVGIDGVTAPEAQRIAKEAYLYGYPMVANYQAIHAASIDTGNPHYKAPFNTISHAPLEDMSAMAPSVDAPVSSAVLDLRAEPVVISVPPMESRRYFSLRLRDLYGYNFAYLGSRAGGNGGGRYLVVGPRWNGAEAQGFTKVIRAETELVSMTARTQWFGAADLPHLKRIQSGYKVQPLSAHLRRTPAPAPAAVAWLAPPPPAQMRSSLEFYNQLGFVLQFAPVLHGERTLRKRLDSLRIRPDAPVVTDALNPRLRQVMREGMHDGQNDIDKHRVALAGKTDTLFGDRQTLRHDYLARATGAQVDLDGENRAEAMATVLTTDAAGQALDGAHSYTLRFAPNGLPPVNAFWSVTLYRMPGQQLAPNPVHRYAIDAALLPTLTRDRDGGLTLRIQHHAPGKGGQANWLPAPAGPFMLTLRYYWPQPALLDGAWQPPQAQRVGL